MIRYCKYGSVGGEHITHDELLTEARADAMLFARAEQSGSEGTYVEVARWSEERRRYERYCFEKFLDPLDDDLSAEASAIRIAAEINEASAGPLVRFIASLPDETERLTLAAPELLEALKLLVAYWDRTATPVDKIQVKAEFYKQARAAIAKAERSAAP